MKSSKDHRQSFRLTRNGFRVRGNGRLFVGRSARCGFAGPAICPASHRASRSFANRIGHYYASFCRTYRAPLPESWSPKSAWTLGSLGWQRSLDQRWPEYGYREPEVSGSQVTEITPVGAGEVSPAERIEQQGKDAAQSRHGAQQGGAGSTRLSPQAGFDVGSREPSDHVEDLNIVGMVRNRWLARAISDAGWGQLVRIIEEKADQYGRRFNQVSRWLASSKTCSACGHHLDELPLQSPSMAVPGCEYGARPRPQRCHEHSRRRAGGENKGLRRKWAGPRQRFRWSSCKTATRCGGER